MSAPPLCCMLCDISLKIRMSSGPKIEVTLPSLGRWHRGNGRPGSRDFRDSSPSGCFTFCKKVSYPEFSGSSESWDRILRKCLYIHCRSQTFPSLKDHRNPQAAIRTWIVNKTSISVTASGTVYRNNLPVTDMSLIKNGHGNELFW